MARYEKEFNEPLSSVIGKVEDSVMRGSMTASLEESSDFSVGGVRCAVRVFERYSWSGSNRVSMSVTMVGSGNMTHLCAVTSGGSQAMFFKMNTFGEEAFLDTLRDALDR